jgi:hypothetical protein
MPLFKPVPPTTVTEAFRAGLRFPARSWLRRRRHHSAPKPYSGAFPYCQARLTLARRSLGSRSVADFHSGSFRSQTGADPNAAKPAARRYFAGNASGKTALGHCSEDAATGLWELTSLSYGDRVRQALQASQNLDLQPGIPLVNSYELRVLRFRGCCWKRSGWFHRQAGPMWQSSSRLLPINCKGGSMRKPSTTRRCSWVLPGPLRSTG